MSRRCVEWAYAQDCGSPGAKFVLVTLADFADEAGSCFPGQDLLAERTGQGVRTVRRQLAELEDLGLLRRHARSRGEGRGRTSDRYVLAAGGEGSTGQSGRQVPDGPETGPEQPDSADSGPSTGTDGPTGQSGRQVATNRPSTTTNRPNQDDQPANVAGEPSGNHQRTASTSGGAAAGGTPPPSAKELVADYVAACAKRPPSKLVGQVAREVADLIADGTDPDDIAGGLARLAHLGINPTVLPSLVAEHQASQAHGTDADIRDLAERRLAGARSRARVLASVETRAEATRLLQAEFDHDPDLLSTALAELDACLDPGAAR